MFSVRARIDIYLFVIERKIQGTTSIRLCCWRQVRVK